MKSLGHRVNAFAAGTVRTREDGESGLRAEGRKGEMGRMRV